MFSHFSVPKVLIIIYILAKRSQEHGRSFCNYVTSLTTKIAHIYKSLFLLTNKLHGL